VEHWDIEEKDGMDIVCEDLLSFYREEEISKAIDTLFDVKSPWFDLHIRKLRKKNSVPSIHDLIFAVEKCTETDNPVVFATIDRNFNSFTFEWRSVNKSTGVDKSTGTEYNGPGVDMSTLTDQYPGSIHLDNAYPTFLDDQIITGKDLSGLIHELKVIKTLVEMEKMLLSKKPLTELPRVPRMHMS
jgi:hypothetical protein